MNALIDPSAQGPPLRKKRSTWQRLFQVAPCGRPEIDQFRKYFQEDIRKGDVLDMVYHPQHGVIVNKNGKLVGVVGGVKFKQALFGIWLSDKPADGTLRQALLTSPTVR